MPANSWPDNNSYDELENLNSLLADLTEEEESEVEVLQPLTLPSRFKNRRRRAAIVLTIVWSGTVALHLVSWGTLFVLGLTTVLGFHAVVMVFASPRPKTEEMNGEYPYVSLLVAAKNEEAVIGNLVKNLCNLEYPSQKYEVWIVDDDSTDKTPQLLAELQEKYDNLKILRRKPESTGGKSGALNQVLPLAKGEIVAVFDADAKVSQDTLLRVVPLFQEDRVGAVQMRKAISNASTNYWTKAQSGEMTVDAVLQQQRINVGGIGELRGNGQFVRRKALLSCGGWNEETITDDLDLTLRLHLDNWDIELAFYPAVEEEGVTTAVGLWHQRNRWAEGGYQRYLDYWDLILKNRMGTRKTWDLLLLLIIQYILAIAGVPDLLMSLARHRLPILSPLTGLSISLSMLWMFSGLKQLRQEKPSNFFTYASMLLQAISGTIYMTHWFIVISFASIRMSVLPKRLKWVKTVHTGHTHEL
ncbi:MAG: glycosyltransferase family 2 protein [Scytonematopsis contorta HA4267-MV1]|jgi:1,2-diacylglycerol 3-beta-glucosyltransferase|nr:glycosyltransferase family 2 protein [Scytonematopsis contorta HA4267-MV1]